MELPSCQVFFTKWPLTNYNIIIWQYICAFKYKMKNMIVLLYVIYLLYNYIIVIKIIIIIFTYSPLIDVVMCDFKRSKIFLYHIVKYKIRFIRIWRFYTLNRRLIFIYLFLLFFEKLREVNWQNRQVCGWQDFSSKYHRVLETEI